MPIQLQQRDNWTMFLITVGYLELLSHKSVSQPRKLYNPSENFVVQVERSYRPLQFCTRSQNLQLAGEVEIRKSSWENGFEVPRVLEWAWIIDTVIRRDKMSTLSQNSIN